jgi:hypothetical protein
MRNPTLIFSTDSLSCVLPDHVWMSLTVAGAHAARYLNTLGLKAGQAPYGVEAGESLPL